MERSDYITPDILKRHTEDPNKENNQFVLCGSPQMEKEIAGSLHQLYDIKEERVFAFSLPQQTMVPVESMGRMENLELPKQPNLGECCGQSCPNCVWMEYVGQLRALVQNGLLDRSQVISLVNNSDVVPSVKAFLQMEVNSWGK